MASSIYHAEMFKNIVNNTMNNTQPYKFNISYEENYNYNNTSNLTNHIGQIFKTTSQYSNLIDMECNINYKQLEQLSQNTKK